jgi:hypothetical protein
MGEDLWTPVPSGMLALSPSLPGFLVYGFQELLRVRSSLEQWLPEEGERHMVALQLFFLNLY